jgi:hypothetical protein
VTTSSPESLPPLGVPPALEEPQPASKAATHTTRIDKKLMAALSYSTRGLDGATFSRRHENCSAQ